MNVKAQDDLMTNEPVAVPPESDAFRDRRAEERIAHKAIVIMPFGPEMHGGFERATLTDCSPKGIGMILSQPLRPGMRFFLKLKLSAVALAVYSVKYCQPVKEGYRIGADFYGISGTDADRESTPESVFTALLAA
jgi:hypothetical protein